MLIIIKKDTLILGKGPTQRLDDTTLTAEAEDVVLVNKEWNFKFALLWVNICIFFNGVEIYKLKAKGSETNAAPLYLDNFSKDFSVNNMKTGYKTGLYGHVYDFSIDYDTIDVDDFSDIH